jgi:hypothetical protein
VPFDGPDEDPFALPPEPARTLVNGRYQNAQGAWLIDGFTNSAWYTDAWSGTRWPICRARGCNSESCNPDERYLNYIETEDEEEDEDDFTTEGPYDQEEDDEVTEFNPDEVPPRGRHWIRAGVELEGAWNTNRDALVRRASRRGTVKGDGSVHVQPTVRGGHQGEFSTRPYKTQDSLEQCVTDMYPDVVNDSCGMHVHTSWTLGDYVRLADPAFPPFFREKMRGYAEALSTGPDDGRDRDALLRRLNGGNDYCRPNDTNDGYAALTGNGQRYRQINYSWFAHKTIECRLLPMFDSVDRALDAIRFLFSVYEEYLNQAAELPEAFPAELGLDYTEAEPDVLAMVETDVLEMDGFDDYIMRDSTLPVDVPTISPDAIVVLTNWPREARELTLRSAATNRIRTLLDRSDI